MARRSIESFGREVGRLEAVVALLGLPEELTSAKVARQGPAESAPRSNRSRLKQREAALRGLGHLRLLTRRWVVPISLRNERLLRESELTQSRVGRKLVRRASLPRLGVDPLIVDAYPLMTALYHLLDRFLGGDGVRERRTRDTVAVSPLLDVV